MVGDKVVTPQDIGKRYPHASTKTKVPEAPFPHKVGTCCAYYSGFCWSLSYVILQLVCVHSSNSHFHASFPPGLMKIPLTGTGVSAINESIGPGGPSGPSADANRDPANKRAGGTSHIGSAI